MLRAQASKPPWSEHLGAFAFYLAAWLGAVGPKILPHLNDRILARVPEDASVFVWSLAWWPHAIAHASNPLLSKAIWAPTGLNLAWTTTAPGPSLLVSPVTLLAGPIASFNVLALLAPPITAWCAYLLTRRITGRFLPALAGGALYGFSPVVMREILQGHLNLNLLFPIPLAAYLVVRRMDGSLSARKFTWLLAAVLVAEFSIFTEVFTTMVIVGALVAILAVLFAPQSMRTAIASAGRLAALSFALALVVVSPYLFTAVRYPKASKPPNFHGLAAGLRNAHDLDRYFVPGPGFLLGPSAKGQLRGLNFWYFGVPLLLILAAFWFTGRHSFAVRLLAAGFFISVVLALGRELTLGSIHIPLPWAAFAHLPVVGRARAGRIVQYAFLFASISSALWLAQPPRRSRASRLRGAAFVVAIFALLPNFGESWTLQVVKPAFFSTNQYRGQLCPSEIVLVSSGRNSAANEMQWQADTNFYFRTVTWAPAWPDDYVDLPTAYRIQRGTITVNDGATVRRFLAEHEVTTILVGGARPSLVDTLAGVLGTAPQRTGGITMFRIGSCSEATSRAAVALTSPHP